MNLQMSSLRYIWLDTASGYDHAHVTTPVVSHTQQDNCVLRLAELSQWGNWTLCVSPSNRFILRGRIAREHKKVCKGFWSLDSGRGQCHTPRIQSIQNTTPDQPSFNGWWNGFQFRSYWKEFREEVRTPHIFKINLPQQTNTNTAA